jgi:uncharacterized protein YkwD
MPRLLPLSAAQRLTAVVATLCCLAGVGAGTATASSGSPVRATHHGVHAPAARQATTQGLVLSPFEARLLALLNRARARNGLRRLTAVPGATDVARRWSAQLAGDGALSHNPNMVGALQSAGCAAWLHVAENVGRAPAGQADALFAAYLLSPHHRHNIMNPAMRFVGIGVIEVAGTGSTESTGGMGATAAVVWNTMEFTDAYDARYGRSRTSVLGPVSPAELSGIAAGWRSRARGAR